MCCRTLYCIPSWVSLKSFMSLNCTLSVVCAQTGKARRLKQAKEEAQQEIEIYRQDCEKQYREHEAKVLSFITMTFLSAQMKLTNWVAA